MKIVKDQNPLIVLRNISKDYTGDGLFCDVNLSIGFGDRISIVGMNGTGKSTLLRIIVGLEEPDDGNIVRDKNLAIGYLPQEFQVDHSELLKNSISQEVYSDFEKKNLSGYYRYKNPAFGKNLEFFRFAQKYKNLVEKLLEEFGFPKKDWEREIRTLSGGEKTKLMLAKILAKEPNLLVLDEPTNHLDLEAIEWLEEFLLKEKKAIICISHDRYFLDKIYNKTFEITKQGLEKYYCIYSEYLKEKEKRLQDQDTRYQQQQRYLEQQQVFIDRFRATASKAKGVQQRIKQLEKLERVEKTKIEKEIKVNLNIERKTCTKVLEIDNLIVGKKETSLFTVSKKIEINWGDKIGIIGKNGAGKSTLLKSILNNYQFVNGKSNFGQGIKIGYYAQEHENLDPKKSILEEVSSGTSIREEKERNILGRLLFTQREVFKKISSLSGGERARVVLAKLILQEPNLLLLDEPTNHLDLPSKEAVVKLFKEFKGTIILISHDRYVLNEICNFIWEIKDRKLMEYLGNYDDYRYHLKQSTSYID